MSNAFTKTFEISIFAENIQTVQPQPFSMSDISSYEKELAFQADRRKATTEFIKIISDLWYDKAIEVVLFKNQIIDKNVSDIINLHEYAGEFVQKPMSIFDSVEILRAINDLNLPPAACHVSHEFDTSDIFSPIDTEIDCVS